MRSLVLLPSLLSLCAGLLLSPAANAQAQSDSGADPAPAMRPHYVGISAGVAYMTARHPELLASSFAAPTLGIHAGYNINDRWSVGFEITTAEKYVSRKSAGDPFVPIGPLAGCTNCEPPPIGGFLGSITALFGTIGPRVEFTPFGRDGVFVGASAGAAFIYGIDPRIGGGGTARAGYRLRFADILSLSIEGGVQGQIYKDASALMPYGVLVLRPYF
jgi:hypothetical protein